MRRPVLTRKQTGDGGVPRFLWFLCFHPKNGGSYTTRLTLRYRTPYANPFSCPVTVCIKNHSRIMMAPEIEVIMRTAFGDPNLSFLQTHSHKVPYPRAISLPWVAKERGRCASDVIKQYFVAFRNKDRANSSSCPVQPLTLNKTMLSSNSKS